MGLHQQRAARSPRPLTPNVHALGQAADLAEATLPPALSGCPNDRMLRDAWGRCPTPSAAAVDNWPSAALPTGGRCAWRSWTTAPRARLPRSESQPIHCVPCPTAQTIGLSLRLMACCAAQMLSRSLPASASMRRSNSGNSSVAQSSPNSLFA